MKTYPCYIRINEPEHYVFSTGMEFKTFAAAMSSKMDSLLMLKGYPEHAAYDKHSGFEYISRASMPSFLQEDVYNYGDFCWADLAQEQYPLALTDEDIAQLLFAAHTMRPLKSAFLDSIQNAFLYLCHDDDYWVKVYMKDISAYKTVIRQKIREVFMGRKKSLSPIPDEIVEELYAFFKNGAIFDFENCTVSSIHTGVRIFPAREIGFCADDVHKELDHQRNIAGIGRYLEYNPKTKKWALL